MEIGSATMWNSMEVPQNIKNTTTMWSSYPVLGICLKNTDTLIGKGRCAPIFTAPLFTIDKLQNQCKYLSTNQWMTKMWRILIMEYESATKKRQNLVIGNNTDGSGGYYAKWNKTGKDKYHIISPICGIFKKKKQRQNKHTDTDNRVAVTREEGM